MSEPIVSSARERSQQPLQTDRRAWVRYPGGLETVCHITHREEKRVLCTATVHNVSRNGLSVLIGTRLEPGASLSVEFIRSTRSCSRPLLVRIVRAAEQPDGDWLIGGEFLAPLEESELENLLA